MEVSLCDIEFSICIPDLYVTESVAFNSKFGCSLYISLLIVEFSFFVSLAISRSRNEFMIVFVFAQNLTLCVKTLKLDWFDYTKV